MSDCFSLLIELVSTSDELDVLSLSLLHFGRCVSCLDFELDFPLGFLECFLHVSIYKKCKQIRI